jgi:hypothetical protein
MELLNNVIGKIASPKAPLAIYSIVTLLVVGRLFFVSSGSFIVNFSQAL